MDELAELRRRVDELERAVLRGAGLNTDALYTAVEAAEMLRCGKTNVYDLIEAGELAVTKIGAGRSGMRVRASALRDFLDTRTQGGPQPKGRFKHLKNYVA